MAFKSYLIEKFDYTHENIYFRNLSEKLKNKFENIPGKHILIGNISCNGHPLDAIFFKSGGISVIDFKDYGGKLTFSENNPWAMENDKELVFVQGGHQSRNPFHQVKAYRFALIEYFEHFLNDSLQNRTNMNLGYISAIVLFQQKINYDMKSIPSTLKWFHIADDDSITHLLNDINSTKLVLSDKEVDNILKIFNVKPINEFDSINLASTEENETLKRNNKFSAIQRLITKYEEKEEYQRIINYYLTAIQIEKETEAKIANPTNIKFDWESIQDNKLGIEINANMPFYPDLKNNLRERFPKNIFVGLNCKIVGSKHEFRLFFQIIPHDALKLKDGKLWIDFCEFNLYQDELLKMDIQEDLLTELIQKTVSEKNLYDKINIISKLLSFDIEFSEKMTLGFSDDPLYTAQLISELKKLKGFTQREFPALFSSFLNKIKLSNRNEEDNKHYIYQITPLNESQAKAIKLSQQQPLTVITGPPGTGKSVVVMNLIANQILNNKTVLFASKNNHAVDTVRERLGDLLKYDTFLRFTSKEKLPEVKEGIMRFISLKKTDKVTDTSAKLQEQKKKINADLDEIGRITADLEKIPLLKQELVNAERDYDELFEDYVSWQDQLNKEIKELFIDKKLPLNVDRNSLDFNRRNLILIKNSFVKRLIFKLFQKNKFFEIISSINNALNEKVKQYINKHHPIINTDADELSTFIHNLNFIAETNEIFLEITAKDKDFQQRINKIDADIASMNAELQELVENQESMINKLNEIKKTLPDEGTKLLNLEIENKIYNMDIASAQDFVNFLPANNIFKKEEVNEFTYACRRFLQDFNAASVTSLSIKNSFPLKPDVFDMLIIDEASQCDIASALPLIFRAKKVVVIGDPLQLKHISHLQEDEDKFIQSLLNISHYKFNYSVKSLFDFANTISNKSYFKSVLLDEHYRCHPEIIEFSNNVFYQRRLGQTLIIRTLDAQYKYDPKGIRWIDVVGEMTSDRRNENLEEVNQIAKEINRLAEKNEGASFGIITPFKNQKTLLQNKVPRNGLDLTIDTVNGFQGDEKDIIILSLVVTNNSKQSLSNFINKWAPQLLNVAVTRARSSLIIVGNHNYCKSLKDGNLPTILSRLAQYVENLKKVIKP